MSSITFLFQMGSLFFSLKRKIQSSDLESASGLVDRLLSEPFCEGLFDRLFTPGFNSTVAGLADRDRLICDDLSELDGLDDRLEDLLFTEPMAGLEDRLFSSFSGLTDRLLTDESGLDDRLFSIGFSGLGDRLTLADFTGIGERLTSAGFCGLGDLLFSAIISFSGILSDSSSFHLSKHSHGTGDLSRLQPDEFFASLLIRNGLSNDINQKKPLFKVRNFYRQCAYSLDTFFA